MKSASKTAKKPPAKAAKPVAKTLVAKAMPAKVSKPAPKSAGSASGAGKKVVVSKPTKILPKQAAKPAKKVAKTAAKPAATTAAKPAAKTAKVAKVVTRTPAKPAPKVVATAKGGKSAKAVAPAPKSAKAVKVAPKPVVGKPKAPVPVAKPTKPSSKPVKGTVAKSSAKPAPKAPAPVKIPVKGKSPVVVSSKATPPLPKNTKVSVPEPKPVVAKSLGNVKTPVPAIKAVKVTKSAAKPVEAAVAKPEVVKPTKSGKLELYVGTFFQEVVPGSPAVRKTKTPHAPVPSLKKPKGEESHDELIARIERELLTVRMVTRKVQRTQVCTKCCINPVEPGYMVDRDTGYCAECAIVLGLGHTREARQQNFHPSLMKSEEEDVVLE